MSRKPRGSGRLIKRKAGGQRKLGSSGVILRPELRDQYPTITRYVRDSREGMERHLDPAGKGLPMPKILLLDRLTSALTVTNMMDHVIGRTGILRTDKPGVLEAHPFFETWLSVNNQILKILAALGLEPAELEPLVLTPEELMAEVVKDRKPDETEDPEPSPDEEASEPAQAPGEKCVKVHLSGAIDEGSECGAGGGDGDGQGGEN